MKRLINKTKTILACKKGESLMESIASILVFTMIMVTIATMIKTSLHITEHSATAAAEWQGNVKDMILKQEYGQDATLTLTGNGTDNDVIVNIPVTVSTEEGFTAFAPKR